MVTREQLRDQLIDLLNHRMTQSQFMDWFERNTNEFTTREYLALKELVDKMKAAGDSGLAWEEYYNFLTGMKYRVKVSAG